MSRDQSQQAADGKLGPVEVGAPDPISDEDATSVEMPPAVQQAVRQTQRLFDKIPNFGGLVVKLIEPKASLLDSLVRHSGLVSTNNARLHLTLPLDTGVSCTRAT